MGVSEAHCASASTYQVDSLSPSPLTKPLFYAILITCAHISKLCAYGEAVSSRAGCSGKEKKKKKDILKILAVFF